MTNRSLTLLGFVSSVLVGPGCAVGAPPSGPELDAVLRELPRLEPSSAPISRAWPLPLAAVPGTWVPVAPGSFDMGVAPGEACTRTTNAPWHHVTLTRAFEIMDTEVTQADYREVFGVGHTGFSETSDEHPIDLVSWHVGAAYCDELSTLAGLPHCYTCEGVGDDVRCTSSGSPYECPGYRLPTEAEWELAYRAGTTTDFYNGEIAVCSSLDPTLDEIAWFLYNSGGRTHPVRALAPNPLGLFDLSGNVWEWTHDAYDELGPASAVDPFFASHPDGLRVQRGGSYNCVPSENRADHRVGLPGTIGGLNCGMRCARTLPPDPAVP